MTSLSDTNAPNPRPAVVGNYLLDCLYSYGVRHIFGIPGDYVIRLNKLIDDHPITFINTTRENTAGYMADAYGRLRGMGVACITYGVGINIANAMAQAYVESSPLVVISGAAGTAESSRGGPSMHHLINQPKATGLDSTQLEIFEKITVAQAVLTDPNAAPKEINRVLTACLRYKKPVYLEFPRNVVEAPVSWEKLPLASPPTSDPEALKEALEEAAKILESSQHPLIWAGHDVRIHGLAPSMLLFAERHGIPVVSTLLGKTVISEKHPLFVGVYQGEMSLKEVQKFAHQSDCAIVLGVMLSDIDTGMFTARLYDEKKIIASPTGIIIGHHHYSDVLFDDFIRGLASLQSKASFKMDIPAARHRIPDTFQPQPQKRITAKRLFECLQTHITGEHIIVTDVGDCLFGATDLILDHNSFLASAYFATLGFGTPGAIAAQLAEPNRRVIGIIGDGAFQMNGMELSTAVRYYLDPIIIVLNNHGYGTERPLIEGKFNDILDWKYTKIPDVLGGGTGIRAQTEPEFNQTLTEALQKRGSFTLIEVDLDTHDFSPAMKRFIKLVSHRI